MRLRFRLLQLSFMALLAAASLGGTRAQAIVRPTTSVAALSNPILFVTQMPIAADFATIGAVFGNHHADMQSVGRGGDLWIRYPDGTLKNLTAAAGYGSRPASRARMRSPCATRRSAGTARRRSSAWSSARRHNSTRSKTFFWQIYEVTGLGQSQTPVITKVPNQPANYNNISPIYGTDDRIIFVSDRPRNGASHLYPQLRRVRANADVNTGLWSLDRSQRRSVPARSRAVGRLHADHRQLWPGDLHALGSPPARSAGR